jgi:hypothetical protein
MQIHSAVFALEQFKTTCRCEQAEPQLQPLQQTPEDKHYSLQYTCIVLRSARLAIQAGQLTYARCDWSMHWLFFMMFLSNLPLQVACSLALPSRLRLAL